MDTISKEIEKLLALANKFRMAIIKMRDEYKIDSTMFPQFPKGKCDYVSNLMMKYLEEDGIKGLTFWRGLIKSPDYYHVWLQVNDICIDITADQFNNSTLLQLKSELPAVIVVRCQNDYQLSQYLNGIKKIDVKKLCLNNADSTRDLEIIRDIINNKFDYVEYSKKKFNL